MTDEAKQPTQEEAQAAHEVAMIQRAVDSGIAALPSQFKTAQELVDSYKNLQGHATKLAQENAALKKPAEKKDDTPVADLAAAVAPVKADEAGGAIDWEAIQSELAANGDLSKETREKLTAQKIPSSLIDAQIQAEKIRREADAKAAADLVGGQKELQDLLEWGKTTLSDTDRAQLSDQLKGPGWKLALLGLQQLKNSKAGSKETQHVTAMSGGSGGSVTLKPFSTKDEMTAAIRDRRYNLDAEYRDTVQKRLRLTYGKPG